MLTICIPTYNRGKEIVRQLMFLESELKDLDNVKVIVSDNCSNAESRLWLKEYHNLNPFFSLFWQKKNLGLIGNVEFLLNQADTEFIWFLGDDDILGDDAIADALKILRNNPALGYLFLNYESFRHDKENVIADYDLSRHEGYIINGTSVFTDIYLHYGTVAMFMSANIYRRENINEIIARIGRPLLIEDFLTFSFFSAAKGPMWIHSKPSLYNNCTKISWQDSGRRLFAIGIPLRLLEYKNLESESRIQDLLIDHYRRSRGSFIYMLLYAGKDEKSTILKSLTLSQCALFISLELVRKPIRAYRRLLVSINSWLRL